MGEGAHSPGYWFPAKRYGWGWGPPRTWQGWVVVLAFFLLLVAGGFVWVPRNEINLFLGYGFFLCCLLFAICYAKGEPPRWRWGKTSDE